MRIDTPNRAQELHQPGVSAADSVVFAFDRDYTVDVNPPRGQEREPVPLTWVAYLAHRTKHIVYATGNQLLKQEASVPGTADIINAHPDIEGSAENTDLRPDRSERLGLLADLYTDAERFVVVDDEDLSALSLWEHYYSWAFVPAANNGEIVTELPPSEDDLGKVSGLTDPHTPTEY